MAECIAAEKLWGKSGVSSRMNDHRLAVRMLETDCASLIE